MDLEYQDVLLLDSTTGSGDCLVPFSLSRKLSLYRSLRLSQECARVQVLRHNLAYVDCW